MKHLQFALLILFIFPLHGIKAQQNHFLYIQTENKQAFYVKLEKKLFSSSASGYLVIPKLKDGTYNLAIGFPKSEWTEQNLVCTINANDAGYLLKNFDEKGWGFFNLQTLAIAMASDTVKPRKIEVVNKTDAFSTMLSNVVNDSTIRQTETVREEIKKVPAKDTEKIVSAVTKEHDSLATQLAVEIPKNEIRPAGEKATKISVVEKNERERTVGVATNEGRSAIRRSLFNTNADGTEMVFIDDLGEKKDTITVFIPADKNVLPLAEAQPKDKDRPKEDQQRKEEQKPKEEIKLKEEPKTEPTKQEEKKDVKFLEIEVPAPGKKTEEIKPAENKIAEKKDTDKPVAKTTTEPPVTRSPMINSDCKSFASDADFMKLRKKMVAEDNDDDMVGLAKKVFKTKCFTVEQVKNLSVLFLKDAGKYSFFDMAYPFVSDSHNFSTLQSQLSETYYINRFQSMIRH